jgi:lipoprotein-releasing system permease protein
MSLSTNHALSVLIGLRYLSAKNSALSYVSRLALLGLVLSVAVLVVVVSVVNGFERELRDRVLSVLPHITAEGYGGLAPGEVAKVLNNAPYPGLVALAPFVSGTALLSANGKIQGASITGIEPATYTKVTDLARYTENGTLAALDDERYGIILGARLATKLTLAIGDQVLVVLPVGAVTPAGAVPRQRRFKLVDVFDSQSQMDGQTALISLSSAQRLFRTGDRVHGVQGKLVDLFQVDAPRRLLYDVLGEQRVRIQSWASTQNGNLYQAIAVQKLTMFVLLSFLVAVAAFNLVSGLMMIVEQRKNDIAILRTLGSSSWSVLLLFCTLGMVLGLCGIALGIAVGVAIATGLPYLYASLSNAFGLELMTQYFIDYLPVDVRMADLLQICLAALGLALLATLYPAWRAARLLPSRVLAHE